MTGRELKLHAIALYGKTGWYYHIAEETGIYFTTIWRWAEKKPKDKVPYLVAEKVNTLIAAKHIMKERVG